MKAVFVPKKIIDEALLTPPVAGKHPLAVFKAYLETQGVPVGTIDILENHEVGRFENMTEIHDRAADLWIGISGEITFVVGGEVIDLKPHPQGKPNEWRGKEIKNGTEYAVGPYEVLYIPGGVPHTHFGNGRLFIIKIPNLKN
ncbi:MAG: hypothetical protein AAB518_04375 [Patescibacteria group bacterium]